MAHSDTTAAGRARLLLAVIRMLNGALALMVPRLLIGRVESAAPPSAAAVYAFRMFGIRTLLIGRDLVSPIASTRAAAVGQAPLIHGCDTATATVLTLSHRVELRKGMPLIAISVANTLLSLVALREQQRTGR